MEPVRCAWSSILGRDWVNEAVGGVIVGIG